MSEIIPNVVVSMPSQLFTLARKFQAASNGKIFIGKIDTDPTIPENQIQVYLENEDGTTVPVSQPLIINQAGYPVYNGQIAKFVTVQGHSMAVYDSYGSQQFYYHNVLKYDPDQFDKRVTQEIENIRGKITDIYGKITDVDAVSSGIDLSDLGYDYSSGDDATPYLDDFLSKYNGTGATVIVSEDCVINTPAWLNAVPNNVNIKTKNKAKITVNTYDEGNKDSHNGVINLRGERGSSAMVVDDIKESQMFVTVDYPNIFSVGDYIEIDLRDKSVSSESLSKSVACICKVTGIYERKIYIDFSFPFDISFSSGGKKIIYSKVNPAKNCTININYNDITMGENASCYGVHLYHAVNCRVNAECSGMMLNGIMHTFTSGCHTNAIGRDARTVSAGMGYLCKVSASKNHSFDSLIGFNVRHTVDYSNASYCKGKFLYHEGDFAGMLTHGFGENNIDIDYINADNVSIANAGDEFGKYSKNIRLRAVICKEFSAGYVENMVSDNMTASNICKIRSGGTYELKLNSPLVEYFYRDSRSGTASRQGLTLIDSNIGGYSVNRCEYFKTVNSYLRKGGSGVLFNTLDVSHNNMNNEGFYESLSGIVNRYSWKDGGFRDLSLQKRPIISTTRLNASSVTISVSNCSMVGSGSGGASLLQLNAFNDTGSNSIVAVVSNNIFKNMGKDSSSSSSSYNVRNISYVSNIRDSSPELTGDNIVNRDIVI